MSARPTAVFLDFATMGPGVDTAGIDRLLETEYFDYSESGVIAERLKRRQIAILNKATLGPEVVADAKDLRLIALTATGTDNVACAEAEARGIAVTNVRDYCSGAVAQHVFALILGLIQRVHRYDELARAGAWSSSRSFALFDHPLRELSGGTLGLVGFGSLGQAVARVGDGLGMRVLVSARPGEEGSPAEGRTAFTTVLDEADVLSLHCPLTPATRHLLGAAEFRRMKRDSIVINTARGALIDEVALVAALRAGEIGGAGIDVLGVEPPPADHPLLDRDVPNLLVTPHIAWAAREARQRAIDQVGENIEAFLRGDKLRRVV